MKRAFTLIELMVVVAIMGVMATVAVISFTSGKSSISEFAAARDVMATIRRARSEALVMQKPVVVTYSNESDEDGAKRAKISLTREKIFTTKAEGRIQTLDGDYLDELKGAVAAAAAKAEEEAAGSDQGETLADVMSPDEIPGEVLEDMKIKVLDISQELSITPIYKSQISIFSTADNVSRTITSQSSTSSNDDKAEGADSATESPVKVSFAANGTVEPAHRIWLYREGKNPEDGVCITVDRFGEPKCAELEGL